MYTFLVVIHIFVCLVLIAVILLQAGRGGGMSEMVGSGQPQSILGTQTNTFMTRATEVCAVVFIITSLSLGIITTQKGKSLIEKERMMHTLATNLPAAPIAPETAKDAAATDAPPAEAPATTNAAPETKSP